MRRALLACLLLAAPAAAQELPRPRGILSEPQRLRLTLEPMGVLIDGGSEVQLRGTAALWGTGREAAPWTLHGRVRGLRSGRRGWAGAGLALRHERRHGMIRPWLEAGVLLGRGDGAESAIDGTAGARLGDVSLAFHAVRTTSDRLLNRDSVIGRLDPRFDGSRTYADVELSAERRAGVLGLEARAGVRLNSTEERRGWVSATLGVPLDARVALRAAAGLRPERAERGEVAGSFVSLGVQLRPKPVARPPDPTPPPPPDPGASLHAARAGPDAWTITVRTTAHRSVEISGDLTDWRPIALDGTASNTVWTAVIAARPGVYHVVVRIDGGEWSAPPGLPAVPDGFGGVTGLLVLH